MTKRERAMERIKKLRQMEQGGTEEEAMVAAQMVAEIMSKYQLDEADIVYDDIEQTWISCERSTYSHPIRYCTPAIALLCACEVWSAKWNGEAHIVYMGEHHDRMVAEYLTRVIMRAMIYETEKFQRTEVYKSSPKKAVSTRSFQRGLMRRIAERVTQMWREAQPINPDERRGLVQVKEKLIKRRMNEIGIKLKSAKSSYQQDVQSFGAGQQAGNNVGLHKGVTGNGKGPLQLGG